MLNKKEKRDLIETGKNFFRGKNAVRSMKYAGIFLLFLISGILYISGGKGVDAGNTGYKEEQEESAKGQDGIFGATDDAAQAGKEGGAGEDSNAGQESQDENTSEKENAEETVLFVHICGAVVNPGVYSAASGTRVYQVIEMAGGLTVDAAGDALNQAESVTDGQKIVVPTHAQVVDGSFAFAPSGGNDAGNAEGGNASLPAKVNINQADVKLLSTLPGIGDAKAQSIISYREKNGKFKTIEEIKNIEGIKDGLFNKIKDYISIN